MKNGFTETPNGLLYAERTGIAIRLFVAFIGASMFMIPVPYIIHAPWGTWSPTNLLALVCIIAPSLLGAVLLTAAMIGARRITFDTAARTLSTSTGSVIGTWRRLYRFDQIGPVDIVHHIGGDEPDWYQIALPLQGRRPLKLGIFSTRQQAEGMKACIAALLSHSTLG
jgi:hypothetical protein